MIVVIGHATLDLFLGNLPRARLSRKGADGMQLCLPFPEKLMLHQMEMSLGGNAVNVGVGLMRLGHKVALLAEVGKDFLGEVTFTLLKEAGFDLGYLRRGGRGDLSVVLSYQGERTILAYHPPERSWDFKLDEVQAKALYLSSLGSPRFQKLHENLIDWLKHRASHRPVGSVPWLFYNPGKDEIDAGLKSLPILRYVRVLYLNKQEAARLLGEEIKDETSNLETIRSLASRLYQAGPRMVVITDGEKGAYGYDGSNLSYQPAVSTRVVERTGAGDAFASGSMAALLLGEDLPTALRWGAVQAASVIGRLGATKGLLTKEEIFETLKRYSRR